MNELRKPQEPRPELIIFGGTFDPPHKGHLGCITLALARFPEARLWVLPAFQPAGAAGLHKSPKASFEARVAMCELMLQEELPAQTQVMISRFEQGLASPNLTVNTLRALRALPALAEAKLCFLIGEDQWQSFSRWAYPHDLLRLSSLLIVKRQTHASVAVPLKTQIEEGAKLLSLELTWYGPTSAYLSALNSWIYYIEAAPRDAVSSMVRQQLQHDERIPEDWLPAAVKTYIDEHRLYQQPEIEKEL